ncbi:MAG: asparaginase [Acholeplasmataceae bacterium]|nr:MAG: asparaginase [Acholeplasmataceae bacterium]
MQKKTILVIFTGGTISMEKHARTKKAIIYDNHLELMESIKNELSAIEILTHEFSMVPSPSFTPANMFDLAKLSDEKLSQSDIDGIVVTHGTDTLEETAYFLDLYLNTEKPVIFTGSMRNFSELGYDGLSNLVSSILVSACDESRGRGVLLVMNDEINAASEVTKSHTLALDTFKSLEFGPIGIVDQDNVLYYRRKPSHHVSDKPVKLIDEVEIVKAYAGSSSLILNLLIEQNIKGLVIEGLGRGNVPPPMVAGIKRAITTGIPVVLTSRCPMGRVLDTYGYDGGGDQLKQLGVIFAENLNSQKARLKLMIALSLDLDMDQISTYFKS